MRSNWAPTLLLYEDLITAPVSFAKSLQADALHPYFRLVDQHLVEAAHSQGLFVIPWTIDRPLYLNYLAKTGVDAIITNTADIAIALLNKG